MADLMTWADVLWGLDKVATAKHRQAMRAMDPDTIRITVEYDSLRFRPEPEEPGVMGRSKFVVLIDAKDDEGNRLGGVNGNG